MYQQPEQSSWGRVQTCDILCPGVFLVSTANYGGIMIAKDMAAVLPPAATKCGFHHSGFLCSGEDTQENVAPRELLDKKLWAAPDRIKGKAVFEESINRSLREHNPDYWRVRQAGPEKIPARQMVPIRNTER